MSAVKRNVQFFRNKTVMGTYQSHQNAIEGASQKFADIAQDPGLLDGEIVLYRYFITGNTEEIHTIVGVVCDKEGIKHISILGNYESIKQEIETQINNTLLSLDSVVEGTSADGQITVKVTQVDGLISGVTVESDINVDDAIANFINLLDGTAKIAEQSGNTITLYKNVIETDGIIKTDVNNTIVLTFANVAFTGKAEDVSVSSTKFQSTNVKAALEEIVDNLGDTYTEGTNVVIDEDNKINVPLGLRYNSTDKKIYLTQGVNEDAEIIDTIDATDFIKDGMLNKAELVETDADGKTGKFIKLTWNTDAGLEDVYIDVTEFIDTYTNGNKWIKVDSYKIYHELSNVMSNPAENETKTTDGPALSTNTPGFGSSFSFKIPSLTIDAAGHVQAVSTNEVSITLPNLPDFQGMIDGIKNFSSIQIVDGDSITATTNADTLKIKGDDEIKLAVAEGQVTINHTQHTPETITTTDVTKELNQTATTIAVPVYEFNSYGHMIKQGTQNYKITVPESNVTTVEAGNGIDLEDNAEEGSNNHEYTISVKLNPNTNDMLTVDANGLNMSLVWECGEYE